VSIARIPAGSEQHPPKSPSPQAEPTLLYVMKQVELAVRSHLDELLKPAGITALQYTALTVLERRADSSAAELARNSFVTTQTMADMVTALESRGLISRRRDPGNRRRLMLRLTASGLELLDAYRGKVAALEERMLTYLTQRQAGELRRYLYQCRAALGEQPPR
jgi:DNA-binding MarR family transcriptional regulator